MAACKRTVLSLLLLTVVLCGWHACQAQTGKPLGEQDVIKLVGIGIDAQVIATRIEKAGIGFAVDDDVLKRLGEAGVSDVILEAVRKAAQAKPKPVPATPPVKAVSYEDMRQLLELGIDEGTILNRLSKSPTIFTLDARQEADLKKLGATDTLLAAMKGARPLSQQAAEIVTDFAVILDCSGSMKELTKEGETKMSAAKRVVTDLIQNIPDDRNLTFVIYGHEVFGGAEDARNCQAVKVVRPLSTLDANGKAELAKFIAGLEPTGATPIALALRTAGEELAKKNGFCGLVLITDGLESCKGDPAGEAAALVAKLKLTFGLHVVGFGVKPEENKALEEIAKAAGDKGKYYPAKSAAELTAVIKSIVPPAPPAVVVKPGNFFNDAPLVEAGEYKGEQQIKTAHYFQIAVQKGQELRAIANIDQKNFDGELSQDFAIAIYDSNLRQVNRKTVKSKGVPNGLISLRAMWTATQNETLFVAVSETAFFGIYGEVQMEKPLLSPYTLRLRAEGPGENGAVQASVLRAAAPGANFQTAGEIKGDGFAVSEMKFGESRYFAVHVQKGDVVDATGEVALPSAAIRGFNLVAYRYTVAIHDDDQVQVVKQDVAIENNPTDAQSGTVRWTSELSGKAYVVLTSIKSEKEPNLPPAKIAVSVKVGKNGDGAFDGAKADKK